METKFKKVAWEIVNKFRQVKNYKKGRECQVDFPYIGSVVLCNDSDNSGSHLFLTINFEDGVTMRITDDEIMIKRTWDAYSNEAPRFPLTRLSNIADATWPKNIKKEIVFEGHTYVLKDKQGE